MPRRSRFPRLLGYLHLLQVAPDRLPQGFGESGGDRIAYLSPLFLDTPGQIPLIREGLKSLDLLYAEYAIAPVERSHVVASPCLDGPGRHVGAQLQEERPVSAAPLPYRIWMPPLFGKEEVVVAGRDLREQVMVLTASEVTGVVRVLFRVEIGKDLACRDPRL